MELQKLKEKLKEGPKTNITSLMIAILILLLSIAIIYAIFPSDNSSNTHSLNDIKSACRYQSSDVNTYKNCVIANVSKSMN